MEAIRKYYDKDLKKYFVPIGDVTEEITEDILELIGSSHAMQITSDNLYCIFSLKRDTEDVRDMAVCRNMLYQWLHYEAGCHYFTSMKFKQYMQNPRYQNAVDYVLKQAFLNRNEIDGWSIALVCDDEGIQFVEVLNVK